MDLSARYGARPRARPGVEFGLSGFAKEGLPSGSVHQMRPSFPEVPAPLAEYADRLLLSTGLRAEDALLIASGQVEPLPELEALARPLRAGRHRAEDRQ